MLTLLSALALAASAPAQSDGAAVQPTSAKPEKPKKICRSVMLTGSRVAKRTCKTEDQWARPEADGNSQLMLQDHGNGPAAAPGGMRPQ